MSSDLPLKGAQKRWLNAAIGLRTLDQASAKRNAAATFCVYVLIAAGLASIFQILIGCDPLVVVLTFGSIAATLVPVRLYGVNHFVGIFFTFMCFYWGLNSLLVKSALLQPLDRYLFSPVLSHLVVFVAVSAASAGAIVARPVLTLSPKLVWLTPTPKALRAIAVVSLALGLLGIVLGRLSGAVQAISIFIASYAILAFVAECARTLIITDRKRALSAFGIATGAVTVLGSIAVNSKFGIMSVALAYVVTVLAFGGKFRTSHVFVGILGAIFVSSYVFPAITFIVRGDRGSVSPGQMLVNTAQAVGDLMVGDEGVQQQIEARNARTNFGNDAGTRYDVPYVRHAPAFFERFMMVPYVDAITRRMTLEGPFAGSSFITKRFSSVLPSFLNADKKVEYSGHEIVWSLRLAEPGTMGFPTMGLPAETFYAGGLVAVAIFSFLIFFAFSILTGATLGRVSFSIFGVFIVSRYVHILAVGLSGNYSYFLVRQLPTDIVLFVAICWISRYFGTGDRGKIVVLRPGGGL